MRISDWSSDVCSSDLLDEAQVEHAVGLVQHAHLAGVQRDDLVLLDVVDQAAGRGDDDVDAFLQQLALLVVVDARSEEHTSELQSLMRISYAVFCLKKKKQSHPIRDLYTCESIKHNIVRHTH